MALKIWITIVCPKILWMKYINDLQYKVIQYIIQKAIKGVKDCSNFMLLFPF